MDKLTAIPILALALLIACCTPSIRYVRDQLNNALPESERQQSSGSDIDNDGNSPPKKPALGQSALKQVAESYIGVPYRYGGTSRSGIDCSGFVGAVISEVYGKTLPRSSSRMWKVGVPVSLSAARPGDLVFFRGGSFGTIDHVGIYMGKDRFIHASTSSGVTYGNIRDSYYSRRFAGARRVL